MAMTGVLRPGHVQIRVLDLEEGVRHYRDIMGLEETGRDAQGRVSGYTRSELLGKDHRLVNSGRHPSAFWRAMWEQVASGRPWRAD